jgi:hypothetical protein
MNQDKYVFAQIVEFLNQDKFRRLVSKYQGDRNEQRDFRIFEDFAYYMIAEACRKRVNDMGGTEAHIYAFDSATIALYLSIFDWAKFRKKKGGIKVHTLLFNF